LPIFNQISQTMKTMFTKFVARSVLLLAFGLFSVSAIADTEPNNSIAEANPLNLETDVDGTLAIDDGDFNDYYQVELPANGDVTITASYEEGLSGFLYLYNASGAQLGFASSATGTLTINCVHSGTVYARASRTAGSGSYTLSVSLVQPDNANDAEPNNSLAEIQASYVENQEFSGQVGYFNNPSADSEDWYYLLSPRDGNITLTATYDDGLSGFIYLYEKDGTQMNFSSISSGTASVTAFCYAEDTVVARLTRSAGCGSYTASFETSTLLNANDTEPNSGFALVQEYYEENEEFTGHLGYVDADFGTDGEDWFGIISPRDGNVVLTATYDEPLSGFIYLYEKDGTQIGSSAISGNTASYTAFCYAADTLIARITRSAGCGSFSASFETTSLVNANDNEPNSGFALVQEYFEENEEFTGHLGYVDADFGTDGEDWFGLLSPRDGNVTLTATYDEPLSGFIYLYEKDGTQISFSAVSGNTASVTAFCYAADTLIARITQSSGCGSYSASFETSMLDNENDLESNNSLLETQTYVTEDEVFTGHLGYIDADFGTDSNDWFGLITEQNGDVTLNVTYDEPLNGFIYLYRKGGAQIGFSSINGTSASFTAFCMAADTIYARISHSSGCGSYSASFEMSPILFDNDTEPNNSIAEASSFVPDQLNEGQIGYFDDDFGTDSDDYYELTVGEAPFDFEMNIVKSTDFGGFLYLYNSAGSQLGFVSHGGLIKATYSATLNESGTYYFRVSRNSGCGSYAIFGPGLDVPIESDPIACSDGIDNNGDGLIDCEDPQCQVLNNNIGCTTCFEDGLSFADEVIEYENNCSNNIATDPTQALGVPDYSGDLEHITLGAGFIKLGFTNNTLINSGNEEPDLFVFEVGPAVEGSAIELRPLNSSTEDILIANSILDSDGDGFYEFGTIGGSTASVDIDSFFDGLETNSLQFDAIKIFDFEGGCGGSTPGPDIDAVCALSSTPCAIGSPCDDGDEMTENDVFNANCECVGEPVEIAGCMEAGACNFNPEASIADPLNPCVFAEEGCTSCNEEGGVDLIDEDEDGICDGEDDCVGEVDALGVCNGDCEADADQDGICDDVDDCVGEPDAIGVCNGDCETDADQDGICDDVDDCVGELDAIGVCNGDCETDADQDGICDDVDDCVGELDAIVVCNGDCEADADQDGICDDVDDCVGEVDANGVCNGDCEADEDGDGICDDIDDCVGEVDALGICNGDCEADADQDGICDDVDDCVGELDALGVCNGDCTADDDQDGICDDVDDCVGELDAIGVCNGDCELDEDEDGICDDEDDCVGEVDALGVCDGDCEADEDLDGICDDVDDCVGDLDAIGVCNGNCQSDLDGDGICDDEPSDCENYVYYLSDTHSDGTTNIYEIELVGSEAELSLVGTSEFEVAIAYNEDDGLIYTVSKLDGSYRVLDPYTGSFGPIEMLDTEVEEITGATFNADGKLMLLSQSQNAIYSLTPGVNEVSVFDGYSPSLGGDIVVASDGSLYLATREGFGTLYLAIPDEIAADILIGDAPQFVTGIADTENENLILSQSSSSSLEVREYDGTPGTPYDITLGGEPFETLFGDLASGCREVFITCLDMGDCYATSAEYVEGTLSNGGQISPNRADLNKALGEPEFVDELVFTSLGFGGSLTFQFDGAVITDEGPDLQIVEVSYGNPGCESYPEYADVSVSEDGEDFYYIGTVCKSNPFVDISDAETEEPLDCVYYVRVENNDELSTQAGDGFDVDGIIAIHNCDGLSARSTEYKEESTVRNIELSAYPNPTNGLSQAVFSTDLSERATLEVYDMNGRLVQELFNGVAEGGVEYRIDFDGLSLPNGVYMYRLTSESETIIEKFMIAK